jgi:hypothetical protein
MYLTSVIQNNVENNQIIIEQVLTTMYILLENCPEAVYDISDEISNTLIELGNIKKYSMRYKVGRYWLALINTKYQILDTNSESLFQFFTENLSVESYQMNFTAAEFYLSIVDEETCQIFNNPQIMNFLQENIKK